METLGRVYFTSAGLVVRTQAFRTWGVRISGQGFRSCSGFRVEGLWEAYGKLMGSLWEAYGRLMGGLVMFTLRLHVPT